MTERQRSPRSKKWLGLFVILLLAGLLGAPNGWAWYHLRAGQSDLASYRFDAALEHFQKCSRIWRLHRGCQILAARSARQAEKLDVAETHLLRAWELTAGSDPDIAFEWALFQASSGHTMDVEEYLQDVSQDPSKSPLCWEALAQGMIRVYRILDAVILLDYWLSVAPDNLRAFELRGLANMNGKGAKKAIDDFRVVLERDPNRPLTRWRQVLCLMDMGTFDEAYNHLQQIRQDRPEDPEVLFRIARCENMLGRPERARQILDESLQRHADHALSLRTRGQFAMEDRQFAEAQSLYERAIAIDPHDHQTHFLLFQCLQRQGKVEASQEQLKLANASRERAERMGEISSRELSIRPLDPNLHVEMGQLIAKGGNDDLAEKWLLSAIRIDPNHAPAHAALTELYTRRGDHNKAKEHQIRIR